MFSSFLKFSMTSRYKAQYLFLSLAVFMLGGCTTTLPKPVDEKSALLMVSIEAKRSIGSNTPEEVLITRKEDGQEFQYTSRDKKYYFFTNLPEGTYQIKTAKIIIRGNTTKTQSGNMTTSFSLNSSNLFNFTEQVVNDSTTHVRAGEVAYMGAITGEGTAKMFPPGSIDITNVQLSKTEQDEHEAWRYFKDKFKESPWVKRIE